MAKLIFIPVADRIESGTYLLYDGACGTGGMLTLAETVLHDLAQERGREVSTYLYGQEINGETYAICKADLLLIGEGDAADSIVGGPEHSTLANDAFPSRDPALDTGEEALDARTIATDTVGIVVDNPDRRRPRPATCSTSPEPTGRSRTACFASATARSRRMPAGFALPRRPPRSPTSATPASP